MKNTMMAILMGLSLLTLIMCNTPKPGVRYEIQEVHAQASPSPTPAPTPEPPMNLIGQGQAGYYEDWALYKYRNTSIMVFCQANYRGGVACVKFTGGIGD